MAWVTPVISWRPIDWINASDYNRIKNNTLYLIEATEGELPVADMGEDKVVNDLWYADEFNTICDNIRIVAEANGTRFYPPYYYPNGSTPTNVELNYIEQTLLNIYNRINNLNLAYMGTVYLGSLVNNRIL